jgi:hypothetical protein
LGNIDLDKVVPICFYLNPSGQFRERQLVRSLRGRGEGVQLCHAELAVKDNPYNLINRNRRHLLDVFHGVFDFEDVLVRKRMLF